MENEGQNQREGSKVRAKGQSPGLCRGWAEVKANGTPITMLSLQ